MMFSDLNFDSSIKIEKEFIDELKSYAKSSKMNGFSKDDYRNKMIKLYNDIGMIEPIDNEINGVIYFDNYDEVGLVLNKKDVSLKQIWTEYRLIYNEKKKEDDDRVMEGSFVLDNFDELFDRVSKKVDGLDKYISDLNSLKEEINTDNNKLESDREKLELEKIQFENYRREEIARLEKLEKDLNDKMDKLNNLIFIFDNKMESLDK